MFSEDGFLTGNSQNQTHVFTSFPNSAIDPDDEQDGDISKASLPLPATTNEVKPEQLHVWQIEYYQRYFDIDTQQVLERLASSMMPRPNKSYFDSHIRQNPDLYGPFWVCVTFILTVAISGNIVNYFHLPDVDFQIDFSKITLSAIVGSFVRSLVKHCFSFFLACLSLLVVDAYIYLFLLSLAFKSYRIHVS